MPREGEGHHVTGFHSPLREKAMQISHPLFREEIIRVSYHPSEREEAMLRAGFHSPVKEKAMQASILL